MSEAHKSSVHEAASPTYPTRFGPAIFIEYQMTKQVMEVTAKSMALFRPFRNSIHYYSIQALYPVQVLLAVLAVLLVRGNASLGIGLYPVPSIRKVQYAL